MSKIIITGNDSAIGSKMGYAQIDDRREIKLKTTERPYKFEVAPGQHYICLNTQSAFKRNLGSGSRDGLTVASSILTNMTEDSWEGTVELEEDDALFIYCETKFKSKFHLKVIDEAEIDAYLKEFGAARAKPHRLRKFIFILLILFVSGTLIYNMLSNRVGRTEKKASNVERSLSDEPGGRIENKVTTEKAKEAAPAPQDAAPEDPEGEPEEEEPEPEPVGEAYHVAATSGLRLRKGPSVNDEIIVEMPNRSAIEVFEIKDGWAHVRYDGNDGYCSAEYIKEGAPPESGNVISFPYFDLIFPDHWIGNYVATENENVYDTEQTLYKVSIYEKSAYEGVNTKEYALLFSISVELQERYFYTNLIGEINIGNTYLLNVEVPWHMPDAPVFEQYIRMYQDVPEVIGSISSEAYSINLFNNNMISDIRSIPRSYLYALTESLYEANTWIYNLLSKDFRLNRNDYVNGDAVENVPKEVKLLSAYGIKTVGDMKAYLSAYFTDSYIESEFMQANENNRYCGSWYDVNGMIYFGYNWGMGFYGLDNNDFDIEYTSGTTLTVHTRYNYPGEVPENIPRERLHFYFVLNNGSLKLDKYVYDAPN